jgi:hypothetical protein
MEDFQKRMLDEHSELKDRWTKLNAALAKDGFREKVGDYQFELMKEQSSGMKKYYLALTARLTDMGLLNNAREVTNRPLHVTGGEGLKTII